MNSSYLPIRKAAVILKMSYFRLWRLIVAKKVTALKVRKKGGRRTVWFINLPSVKRALEKGGDLEDLEIVERVTARK